jgi:hypothetical protein
MNTYELFEQDKIWITADRMSILLVEMDAEHRRNTLAMLRRRAAYQMKQYNFCELQAVLRMALRGMDLPDDSAFDPEMALEPEEWLERRPLIIELARLVAKDELDANTVEGEVVVKEIDPPTPRAIRL